jgi:hypothetical protein
MNTATSIDTQIAELTARKAELENIAREEKRVEEKKVREAARIAELTKFHKEVNVLAEDLMNADTAGVLTITTTTHEETGQIIPTITFMYKGKPTSVDIEEHVVYGSGYRGNKSHGLKYRLTGGYNDYTKRMYKTSKSVLKKIAEIQEIELAAQKRISNQERRNNEAFELLTSLYEGCSVERKTGWTKTYDSSRGYEYTYFEVSGKNGKVHFSQSQDSEGNTTVVVSELVPTAEFKKEIADNILLG